MKKLAQLDQLRLKRYEKKLAQLDQLRLKGCSPGPFWLHT
jgi:hypothetical protein